MGAHDTKPNPTRQHSRKTSSAALYAHGVIYQSFTISSHFKDRTKLDQKGRKRWGRVVRASLPGRSGGEGKDKVHSRIQLVEGVHGRKYERNDQINRGGREGDGGYRRLEVDTQFVKVVQIPGRAPQFRPPCRNDRNCAGIGISWYLLQLVVFGQLGL